MRPRPVDVLRVDAAVRRPGHDDADGPEEHRAKPEGGIEVRRLLGERRPDRPRIGATVTGIDGDHDGPGIDREHPVGSLRDPAVRGEGAERVRDGEAEPIAGVLDMRSRRRDAPVPGHVEPARRPRGHRRQDPDEVAGVVEARDRGARRLAQLDVERGRVVAAASARREDKGRSGGRDDGVGDPRRAEGERGDRLAWRTSAPSEAQNEERCAGRARPARV